MSDFKRLADDSYSRANALRPLHSSLRRYFTVSIIFFASLSTMSLLHSVETYFGSGVSVDVIGAAAIGSGCALLVVFATLHLTADCIRRWAIARMSRNAVRSRLISEDQAHRYHAEPKQLKGMTIGAVFFGVLCTFMTLARLAGWAS